jgi:hypothetical protein
VLCSGMPPDDTLRLAVPLAALVVSLIALLFVAQWAAIRALRRRWDAHDLRIRALEDTRRAELYPPHDRTSLP